MKKTILAIAFVFSAITASAQFYVSASGGATLGANEKVIGTTGYTSYSAILSGLSTYESNNKGSFGEGFTGQLRLGYFFNETIGLELGFGYLHGTDQTNNQSFYNDVITADPFTQSTVVDMYARGRAFGGSLSAVVNVTKNVYTRIGLLTKIGGKTESHTTLDLTSSGADVQADFQTDFKGKLPFGFIGALGYKFNVSDNIKLFVEAEYFNISVTRKSSSLVDFSGTFNDAAIDSETLKTILGADNALAPLLEKDYDWSDSGAVAPYSSIGLNIGVTYTF